jgi:hypothetical protein
MFISAFLDMVYIEQNTGTKRLLSINLKIKKCKNIILPVALFGYRTWSLTLTEEHILRLLKNRVLRIFGPKKEEVARGRRRLHNEELHNLYASLDIIRVIKSRRMRWVGQVARMETDEKCI